MTEAHSGQIRSGVARRLKHLAVLLIVPLLIAGVAGWAYLHGGRYVSTDNAYVKTEILSISPNVAGMVTDVFVRESEPVTRGQLLMTVDNQPYKIAVARAEANLVNVRGDIESLKAEFINKQLEIETATSDLDYQSAEMERIRELYEQNSISGVQFDQATHTRNTAQRELAEKRQALEVVRARLIDPALVTDSHPRVRHALAELEKARLDLSHTEMRAPANGIVVNITSHVGENVMTGAPVMNLIDASRIWLSANFKETDLTYLHIGQTADITVDTFPGRTWRGHVAVITPATGAEFSLLPAQNSTGNWIKIVQRVPIQVVFDDREGLDLLASGMSAEVTIDTGHLRSLSGLVGSL